MSEGILQAENAIKAGDTKNAFELLRQALAEDPDSERAWWIMSGLVQHSERINCLEQVLRINPENQFAREALNRLKTAPPKEEIKPEREIPKPARTAPVTTLPDEYKTWHFTKGSRLYLIILGQERLIRAQAQTDMIPRIQAAIKKKILPHEYLEEIKSIPLNRIQAIREAGSALLIRHWDKEVERTTRFELANPALCSRILDYLTQRLSPDYELQTKKTRTGLNLLISTVLVVGSAVLIAIGYWSVISGTIQDTWLKGIITWLGPGGVSLVGAVFLLVALGISGGLLFRPRIRRELVAIGLDLEKGNQI
jgi:tetratricopeptide (TPR) repeat protein